MKKQIRVTRSAVLMSVFILTAGFLLGCSEKPTAGPNGNSQSGENSNDLPVDPGPAPGGQSEPDAGQIPLPEPALSTTPQNEFAHVIVQQVDYYKAGPQQASAPDGKLTPGTKVQIIRQAGSYTEVKTEDGRQGYVAADSVQVLQGN